MSRVRILRLIVGKEKILQAIANSINGNNGSNGNKTAVAIVVIPKPAIPYLQLVV